MASISVIIPCYNAAKYVGDAIATVRAQQVAPHTIHEIILVDDGCTDDSVQVACSADPSVRVISQANAGISAARNTGVHAATGDWIAFLDADDLWPADSLSSRARWLAAHPDRFCVAGGIEQFISPEVPESERDAIVMPPGVIAGRLAGALLVHRTLFQTVGLFSLDLQVGETLDWVARVDTAGHTTGFVPDLVLRRRIHGNNSVQKSQRLRADYLSVLRSTIRSRRASRPTPTIS